MSLLQKERLRLAEVVQLAHSEMVVRTSVHLGLL